MTGDGFSLFRSILRCEQDKSTVSVELHDQTISLMSPKNDKTLSDGRERERTIIERQLNGMGDTEKQALSLLKYATPWDKAILIVSSICAILAGALNPLVPVRTPFLQIVALILLFDAGNLRLAHQCLQWIRRWRYLCK
jgi:hypothetical protein